MEAFAQQWDHVESNVLVASLNRWSQDLTGLQLPKLAGMHNGISHLPFLAVSVVVYLVVIFGLQWFLKRFNINIRNSQALNNYAFVHNVFMSLFSLYMFLDAVVKAYQYGGLSSWHNYMLVGYKPSYDALHDLFYWSKFLELIDTLILVTKNKDLGFLHVFHHCTTASVCYGSRFQPLWMGVWTNGLVHVFMYAHFARPMAFIRPRLTSMQIIQFIFVLTSYNYWWLNYTKLPFTAVLWGDICYGVYLLFFCKFFYENYISKPRKQGEDLPSKKITKKE